MGAVRDDARGTGERIAPPPWSPAAKARDRRADKPVLSREAIVAAALRIVDAEGLDAVSMRRLAQEFDTGPASLYAHVANKEELLDLVVDEVMGEFEGDWMDAEPTRENWQEILKEGIRHGQRVIAGHRDVAKAFVDRIPFGPNGLRITEWMLSVLRAGGVADRVAAFAGDLVGQYLTGTVIEDYAWKSRFPDAGPEQIAEQMGQMTAYLAALPAARFPNLVRLSGLMTAGEEEGVDRFELGLEVLVRGLASFVEAVADPAD